MLHCYPKIGTCVVPMQEINKLTPAIHIFGNRPRYHITTDTIANKCTPTKIASIQ